MTTALQKSIHMFGDPVDIQIDLEGRSITGVTVVRGNERCRTLVGTVDRQIKAGRELVQQQWNIVALAELLSHLLDVQFAKADAP